MTGIGNQLILRPIYLSSFFFSRTVLHLNVGVGATQQKRLNLRLLLPNDRVKELKEQIEFFV